MRITHLLPFAGLGGVERTVLNLCIADCSNTHSVLATRPGPIIREFNRHKIDVEFIPKALTSPTLGLPYTAMLSSCDVLHVHTLWGQILRKAEYISNTMRIPSIVTIHGRWVSPRVSCPVVCVSPSVAESQLIGNSVDFIYNGVNTREFAFSPARHTSNPVIVRCCRPDRSSPLFWKAASLILEKQLHAQLWIIGEVGLSSQQIRFLGERRDVANLLKLADIFAYAPFPGVGAHDNCILEAMAVGLPVVATDVCGVRESVLDGRTGYLISPDDIEGFVEAVCRFVESQELRYTFGQNARNHITCNYDIDLILSQYLKIYMRASILKITPGPQPFYTSVEQFMNSPHP